MLSYRTLPAAPPSHYKHCRFLFFSWNGLKNHFHTSSSSVKSPRVFTLPCCKSACAAWRHTGMERSQLLTEALIEEKNHLSLLDCAADRHSSCASEGVFAVVLNRRRRRTNLDWNVDLPHRLDNLAFLFLRKRSIFKNKSCFYLLLFLTVNKLVLFLTI